MELSKQQDNPPIGGDDPLEAAASYYHLHPAAVMGDPGVSDRGTRLEVERISSQARRSSLPSSKSSRYRTDEDST